MALSEANRVQVRLYMGWSARFHQSDSALERAMSALDGTPDTEALIVVLIAECQRVDAALLVAETRFIASKADEVTLNDNEHNELRSRGEQSVARMASTLGVEVRNNAFRGHLPRSQASHRGLVGGSNYTKHG